MGNIIALNRAGQYNGNYTYNYYTGTNQLQNVTGLTSGNYTYDANGNMNIDARNGTTVYYNFLNLPRAVTGNATLNYTYNAAGQKLRKTNATVATDYISGIQYDNNTITFIQTEEGRALNNNGSYLYEYTLSDHLGNSRISFDQNSGTTTKQQDNYYPFGLAVEPGTTSPPNKYLYNKKSYRKLVITITARVFMIR